MARPHIEFTSSPGIEREALAESRFAGLQTRMLSADDADGSFTAMVDVPAGWSGEISETDEDRAAELLVLKGTLELAGQAFVPGCYAYVPSAAPDSRLSASEDALLLFMREPSHPDHPEARDAIEVIDTNHVKIADHGTPGVPPGLLVKPLHTDAALGDWTWICSGAPAWQEDRAEVHPTIEEAFVLRGDVLLGRRGEMVPGDYFWRPPNVPHGPMYIRDGNLIFFRTKGGGMEVTYEEVPGWRDLVAAYRERSGFYVGQ
jgi:hypothetical protein